MSNVNMNYSCPTFCWRTQYDNDQQKLWCPIAQQPQVNSKGQILGQNTDLMQVVTGGTMKVFNPVTIEGYRTTPDQNFFPVSVLANDMMGPIRFDNPAPLKENYSSCGCGPGQVMNKGINMMAYQ